MLLRLCVFSGRIAHLSRNFRCNSKFLSIRLLSSASDHLREPYIPQPLQYEQTSSESRGYCNIWVCHKFKGAFEHVQSSSYAYIGVTAALFSTAIYLIIKERTKSAYLRSSQEQGAIPIVFEKIKEQERSITDEHHAVQGPPPVERARPERKSVTTRYEHLPEEIPYLLIGSGTASYYASLAIRARDADAKVLIIGDEKDLPYNRSPLSKELWWYGDDKVIDTLEYKGPSGRTKDIYYETNGFYVSPDEITSAKHGGVSLVLGHHVKSLDVINHLATLDDGRKIKYKKCLIATGSQPKRFTLIEEKHNKELNKKVSLFHTVDDFCKLDEIARKSRSITVIGGGLLGSELVYSLNKRYSKNGLKVNQVFREKGNAAEVLPLFLAEFTSNELRKSGINVLSGQEVKDVTIDDHGCVKLLLTSGDAIHTDHVVIATGTVPNTDLAKSSGLEIDEKLGGFLTDAELRARSDVWIAGDASSFYDLKLGRRRVEHWEHAEVTGRLAGENMTGGGKPYWHQSSYYCLIAPNAHFEAVGITDSKLPTVSVFAADKGEPDNLWRGVVFYMSGRIIVGVVLFNIFGSGVEIARKLISDEREHHDLKEVAKLFELHKIEKEVKAEDDSTAVSSDS